MISIMARVLLYYMAVKTYKEVRPSMKVLKKLGVLCVGVAFALSLLIPVAASAGEVLPPEVPPPSTPPPGGSNG